MGAAVTPRKAAATLRRSPARTTRITWAKLLGEEFPLECPNFGGDIRLIAFITEPGPIPEHPLKSWPALNSPPAPYFSEDWGDEKLIELKGIVLGYAERDATSNQWTFHRPRRLPQHLSDVFHVTPDHPEVAAVVRTLMQSQLGQEGIYIGDLLAGESSLVGVPVYLPPFAFSHHIGIFGRTGCGKSNLMMV
jgi:hypothetical protein